MSTKQSSRIVEQTKRNIDLAFQLLEDIVADDTALDEIPNEGTIVLLPFDDPSLTLQNLAMALRLASGGETVYLRRIGAAPASNLRYIAHQELLRWIAPLDLANQMTIEYDPITRAEVFDFSGGQRSTIRLPISTELALLVDLSRREAVGYSVPETSVGHLSAYQDEATHVGYASNHRLRPNMGVAIARFMEDLVPAMA